MKKFLFALMIVFLASCSSGPEKAAKEFTENLSKGKISEAKKYCTESTGQMIEFASQLGGLPIDPNFKFNMVKDSIVGNKAWITYKDQDEKQEVIELVKIDGNWKVHMQSKK